MKILTVLGARPQFIKAAAVSRVFSESEDVNEVIVHTGQHFDKNMSAIFFEQLEIPQPQHNLGIDSLSHGAMTARMLEKLEELILKEKPAGVLVYGDTNSTLAGALAASKLHIPIIHVEAGLRSFNVRMPEEINRVLTDRLSNYLFCPSEIAINNLKSEGFPFKDYSNRPQIIKNVGDVMFDALHFYREKSLNTVDLNGFGVTKHNYVVCTIHRQENTEDIAKLRNIVSALNEISKSTKVILPMHPRTAAKFRSFELNAKGLNIFPALPYLEMQRLIMEASCVITDSGGLQKEAYFHRVPCVTLREETEWTETITTGWNTLVGNDVKKIVSLSIFPTVPDQYSNQIYGSGSASLKILKTLGKLI